MKKTVTIALIAALGATTLAGVTYAKSDKKGGGKINFEQIDANADGFITLDEMQAHQAARFETRDANGDGFLSEDELKAGIMARAEEAGREVNEDRLERRIGFMLRGMDVDNDGKISMSEATKRDFSEIFERADANGDGQISQAELEEIRGKRKGKDKKEG
ncbi:MAG: calcium-binding protein [Pseudomonadota bacterium]